MRAIGIHDGHGSAAALMEDGVVVFAVQEERLTRVKNTGGFPTRAVKELLEVHRLSIRDIDAFVFVGNTASYKMRSSADVMKKYRTFFTHPRATIMGRILKRIPKGFFGGGIARRKRNAQIAHEKRERIEPLLVLGVPEERIVFVDHHTCHAASAAYGWGKDDVAVITSDSSGDGISGSVSIFEKGVLTRRATIDIADSIARIYSLTTFFMGMVPTEHEYKIMGMSPYAEDSKSARGIADYFHGLFEKPKGLTYTRTANVEPTYEFGPRLEAFYRFKRFDHISAGLQLFVEEYMSTWVQECLRKFGKRKVALSGGLFMNIKLNKRIMELPEVEDMFIFPSCGDESNVFGALYYYFHEKTGKTPEPLSSYYLGRSFTDAEIEKALTAEAKHLSVEKLKNPPKRVAELLAEGRVVARFDGRMEFGARALGNRSILAHPGNYAVVREINRMIKSRDFWMPFAPATTKLNEYADNPKRIAAPYMILAFNGKKEKVKRMPAAIHPYDETVRPQEVARERNPGYYEIIEEFGKMTGEAAILNTSFNLHGHPIVYTPQEALEVLMHSGLQYLVIGHYLVSKNNL